MKILSKNLTRISISPNKQRVATNLYWALIGKSVSVLGELFSGILVARFLGPENFGLFSYIISYVMIFSVFANFGLDGIEIRELSKQETNHPEILGTSLTIRFFLSVFTLVIIILSVFLFESDKKTSLLIAVYSFSVLLSPSTVLRNYFSSIIKHEYTVKSEIFRTVIGTVIKIGVLLLSGHLVLITAAFAFDYVLVSAGYIYMYKKTSSKIVGKWRYNRSTAIKLINTSYPLLISTSLMVVYTRINFIFLRYFLSDKEVGFYSTAFRLTEVLFFATLIISQSIVPLLVIEKEKNLAVYEKKKIQFMTISIWLSFTISITLAICSGPIIDILYGSAYTESKNLLKILSWRIFIMTLANTSGHILIIENLEKHAYKRNLIGCILIILLNLIFISRFGVIGSCYALLISALFAGYFSNYFIPSLKGIFYAQNVSLCKIFYLFKSHKPIV